MATTSSRRGNLCRQRGSGSLASRRRRPWLALGWAAPCLASYVTSIGCGASTSDDTLGASCASREECSDGQLCENEVCVGPATGSVAAPEACAVLSCPEGEPSCCRGMTATAIASGLGPQDYETRLDLVEEVSFSNGEVKVIFSFTEAGQQGWVVFDLGAERELSRVGFRGSHDGVADRFLTLSANGRQGGGCVFAFELQPRPAPVGSSVPFVRGSEVPLVSDDFCFEGGAPGRASELVFGVFASQRGRASLTVSDVTLTPDGR